MGPMLFNVFRINPGLPVSMSANQVAGKTRRAIRTSRPGNTGSVPFRGFRKNGKKKSTLIFTSAAAQICFTWFYLEAEANAFAVALMIASDVMVALLVVSTPLTLCLEMIFAGVSVIAE